MTNAPDSVKEPDCELHLNVRAGPFCPICLLNERDALRQSLALAQAGIEELRAENARLSLHLERETENANEYGRRAEKAEASLAERGGCVMVPVEPTEEMIRAGMDAFKETWGSVMTRYEGIYKAMLAAVEKK